MSSLAYQKFRAARFFGSLDGLRALSILGVVWVHTWLGTPYYEWLRTVPILRNGAFGVDVFFTISGFLITTLLLRERDKYGTVSLRDFYIRRSLRIWPLYYAVLLLYVVLVSVFERGTDRGRVFFRCLPSYATYTYTWFAPWWSGEPGAIFNFAWSLSTEEQFYVFWPVVIKLFRRTWPILVMALVVTLRVADGYGLLQHWLPAASLANRIVASIAVPICMGALLAQVLHIPRGFGVLHRVLGSRVAAPAALVLLAASVMPASAAWAPLSWVMLPMFIGACVIREDNGLVKLLHWRPLAFMGVVSYGMYLFNTLAVKAVRPVLGHIGIHHPLWVLPFSLGLTVLMAWLSFRYFESPFLALKSRFARLPAASPPAPPT